MLCIYSHNSHKFGRFSIEGYRVMAVNVQIIGSIGQFLVPNPNPNPKPTGQFSDPNPNPDANPSPNLLTLLYFDRLLIWNIYTTLECARYENSCHITSYRVFFWNTYVEYSFPTYMPKISMLTI